MARSSESIETQPPPEVRLDKLQPDVHPPQPEPRPAPQPRPQDQQNGDRSPPPAALAPSYQPRTSSESPVNPVQSKGNGNGSENRIDEKESGNEHPSTTGGGPAEESATGRAEATAPAAPASLPPPHVPTTQPHNGQDGQDGTRNGGDTPLSPSPPMSGARPPPDGLPRPGQIAYSGLPSYQPPPNLHAGAQYGYPAQIPQQHDPYRASPTAVNSAMALPSMRTFDHQQQPQQPQQPPQQQSQGYTMAAPMGQPMAGPMGGQMGLPLQAGMTAAPVGVGYYSNTLPPSPYGMQVDSNGVRYAILPEIDPRIILANRQKKVSPPMHLAHRALSLC